MKVWAKVVRGDKILKDVLYETSAAPTADGYRKILQGICYALDVSTPVSLPAHLKHFLRFNRVKYLPRDFVDDVDFGFLVLELVSENR